MTEPIRATDPDVWTIRTTPEDSPAFKEAMSRLVKRLAASVDERIAQKVYGHVDESSDDHR